MAARGSEGACPPPATAEADAVDTTVAQRARGRRDDRWYIILDRRWWEIIIVGPDLELQSNGMVVGLLALMSCRCPVWLWLFLNVVGTSCEKFQTLTNEGRMAIEFDMAHHEPNLLGFHQHKPECRVVTIRK